MDWWNKLKRVMGVPEDEFMTEEEPQDYAPENKRKSFFESRNRSTESFAEPEEKAPRHTARRDTYSEPVREERHRTTTATRDRDPKYMNINATAQLQVVLVKPEDFHEAPQIADHLIAKKTVLLNLEGINRETVRRMIDFLSGVAYAQGGTLKRVANGTFIITPYDVDIMGDILDELKMDRMSF